MIDVLSANVQRVRSRHRRLRRIDVAAICRSWGLLLAYLPAANAKQKFHHIALLLFLKLLEVLVGAHL